jgi:PEP-CTERM motif
MRQKLFSVALATCTFCMAAYADILTPGQVLQPPDVLSLSGMTLVDTEIGITLDSLTFDATLDAAVYSGEDVFCPTTSCMTFVYQVTDNSAVGTGTGIIEDLTSSSFSNFMTDVGYEDLASATGPFVAGGTNPDTVGRSASGPGAVVTFDYPDAGVPANDILPGDHTSVLIVETDSTTYTTGLFSAIDGATATVSAFAPASPSSATPEPGTFILSGLGMLGLSLVLKRVERRG